MNYFDILLAKKLSGGSPTPPGDTYERKSVTSYPVTDAANYPLPKVDVTVTDADKCEVIVTTDNTITEDSGVYIERQSGGGNRELDEIVGGSVVWNQLVQNGNFDTTTNWAAEHASISASNNIMAMQVNEQYGAMTQYLSLVENHKYLLTAMIKGDSEFNAFNIYVTSGVYFSNPTITTSWGLYASVVNYNKESITNRNIRFQDNRASGWDNVYFQNVMLFDLTALFGSTIADYIYSLEQATSGSGIAWAKSNGYFTKFYYGYTANKIESVSVARHITRGVNQWDEQWESGSIDNSGGLVVNPNYIRSKNYINTKPSTNYNFIKPYNIYTKLFYYGKNNQYISYYELTGQSTTNLFTTPSDCYYMKFVQYRTTYNDDVSINYPSTDTSYHAYHAPHTYPINPITLRGIPKLNASNQLYYDGDIYEASGRVTRKYGVVDMGTLEWNYVSGDNSRFTANIDGIKTVTTSDDIANLICTRYTTTSVNKIYTHDSDKTIGVHNSISQIWVYDSAYNDATAFKTAVSGVMLVYELSTPTTEYTSPFEANQIVDANGTEQYIDAGVEAGTRDVAIPVGHDTKYFNGKAYVKPLTAGTSDTVSMADEGIMPTSPMYISANGEIDAEYWKQTE